MAADDDARGRELVEFTTAKNPFEAKIIVAVLEDAGIPAFVPGGLLADEFQMAQRLMNLQAVSVQVPAEHVEAARAALAAAREVGKTMSDEGSAPDDGGGDEQNT